MELLCRHVSSKNGKSVALDIGCGVGEFMLILRDIGFEVEGIDANEEQMQIVHSNGLRGKVGNLENGLPYPNEAFSLVTCLELIEHIALAEDLLDEIQRVLRLGGYLLLSTPNFAFFNNRFHYLFGAPPCNEGMHLRFFVKSRLESMLEQAGFDIVSRNSYGPVPLLSTLTTRLLRQEPVLWRVPAFVESLFAYDLIYLARKST